jgi:hypothetical protein
LILISTPEFPREQFKESRLLQEIKSNSMTLDIDITTADMKFEVSVIRGRENESENRSSISVGPVKSALGNSGDDICIWEGIALKGGRVLTGLHEQRDEENDKRHVQV